MRGMDDGSVETTARQVGWVGAAAAVLGLVVALVGDPAVGGVLIVLGFGSYLVTQYLASRYSGR